MPRVKIDGVEIKPLKPEKFKVERYNLTKSGRVSSGKMMMDIIAKKHRLDLSYDVLSAAEFQKIRSLIDGYNAFFTVEWLDHDGWHSAVCYAGAIPQTFYRADKGYYYKDISFALIEQ